MAVPHPREQGQEPRRARAALVPFASHARAGDDEPAVSPDRFLRAGEAWPGHWATPPRPWEDPERRLASLEARAALAALPATQHAVLTLRDVEGLDSDESAGNQRVILHRARARLRTALAAIVELNA